MLTIKDLHVSYPGNPRPVRALDGVSLDLARGQALGILGETGSGKSTLALTLMGLAAGATIRGEVGYCGRRLPLDDEAAMRRIRWRHIALAFQAAGSAFDPVYAIGRQIVEPMLVHLDLSQSGAEARARALVAEVGLRPETLDAYPHQLSGGEKKRAMIAMALSCEPDLLILDEPTTGLDVLARRELFELLAGLRARQRTTLIVISHDLGDLARLTDCTAVLYAGHLIELGQTAGLLEDPCHPYTWGLVNAYPLITRTKDLRGIRGELPDPTAPPPGCRFHPRCTQAAPGCAEQVPALAPPAPGYADRERRVACHLGGLQTLLSVQGLQKTFHYGRGSTTAAVRGVTLSIREGEVVGLVGQSGSGKTTLARLVIGLETADGGRVYFEGRELVAGRGLNGAGRRIQLIFQDPFEALSTRMTVRELVREPLDIQRIGGQREREEAALEALSAVNLPTTTQFLACYTHELSGGQLQRVAIARALVSKPKLILADEPVSMLDASEQAKVLQLLKRVQNEQGMGLLLISHDIGLVRKVADRIAVMQAGQIVEMGPSERILASPQHPYSVTLVEASRALFDEAPYNVG
ncbi:MAG TPA: ABC transporter ATP-binding protein [Anaerolineae bacterium]|nr:ABC transporter ATP-binding protein [Anaerolineae bacterium]